MSKEWPGVYLRVAAFSVGGKVVFLMDAKTLKAVTRPYEVIA